MINGVEIPYCVLEQLTPNELRLYAYMKYHAGKSMYFEFPKSVYTDRGYAIYKNTSQFYKDRNSLIKKGILEHIKGIYCSEYRILK